MPSNPPIDPWYNSAGAAALATVDFLPDQRWNAKAAAGDALSRVGLQQPFVAVWIDEGGHMRSSYANVNGQTLSTFSVYLAHQAILTMED